MPFWRGAQAISSAPASRSNSRARNETGLGASARLGLSRSGDSRDAALEIRLQQAVQVDDHIFHFRIVDAALRFAPPRVLRGGEAVVDADEIDVVEIDEVEPARI